MEHVRDGAPAPNVVLLAGPNGAGKTTASRQLLQGIFAVDEFVNADVIAAGMSVFRPEEAAFQSGRIMLQRLHDLAERRVSFAFETTSLADPAKWATISGDVQTTG